MSGATPDPTRPEAVLSVAQQAAYGAQRDAWRAMILARFASLERAADRPPPQAETPSPEIIVVQERAA